MSIAELKNLLIAKIIQMDDEAFLQSVMTILKDAEKEKILRITPEIHSEINLAMEEIQQGYSSEHKEVLVKMESWLKEK